MITTTPSFSLDALNAFTSVKLVKFFFYGVVILTSPFCISPMEKGVNPEYNISHSLIRVDIY